MIKAKRIGVLRRELMDTPRRRFVIPGVLPVGTSFWYGDNSVGKTGLVIRTSVALAAGLRWADREVSRGCVLYVAGEDFPGVTERLSAAIEHLGLSPDDLPISVMPCPEKGMVDVSARQQIANEAKALVEETGLPMSLIVFDTLATCFGDEDQDGATAAGKYMKNAERLARDFECAALTVHHTGHRGKEMRGSSVFRKAADAVFYLDRLKARPTVAEVTKMRGAPEGYKLAFDITGTDLLVAGGPVSVQVVKNLNAWTEAEKTTKEEDKAKRELTDAAVALTLLASLSAGGSVSKSAWRDACFTHWSNKPSDNARKAAFSKAMSKLVSEGQIAIHGDTVTVTVTENHGNNPGNPPSPDTVTVTVTVTAPPSMKGADGNSGESEFPLHKPDGSNLSEGTTEDGEMVGRPNGLPPGCGTGSPARRHSAAGIGNGNSDDGRATDAA